MLVQQNPPARILPLQNKNLLENPMPSKATACMLCCLSLLFLTACNKHDAASTSTTPPVLNVQTVVVQEAMEPSRVELAGSITGERSVALSTKLMSKITYLEVEEGERVKAGQVLARIDDADIQAMRNEAAAYRAEAAAAAGEVQAVVAQSEAAKAQAEAAVGQAQAVYSDAKCDFERADRLAQEDSIPRAQRDKAALGLKIAEENLSLAKSAVKQAEAGIVQAESKTPQIEAKQQQAAAKDAQVAALQEYATIVAPFDGVVTKKFFEQGQLSLPGQPLLIVEDAQSFRVQVVMPAHLVPLLKLGDTCDVMLDTGSDQPTTMQGELVVLGSAANPASHTVKAELKLASCTGVFSGQFARVLIPAGEKITISIPENAVIHDRDMTYVWRVSTAGVLAQCPVDTSTAENGMVTVLHGLSNGDRIVTQPSPELYAGAPVQDSVLAVETRP
jgi:multidrug efflux pump subunit AcrA (membrane-fusion protein)